MNDAHKFIVNLSMPEKVTLFKELYNELAGQGIEGDTELAHVNTFEASLLKSIGGSGTLNEVTGLREYKGGGSPPPPPPATSQTVTQTSEFPTELKPFIKDVLGEAQTEFQREQAEGYLPFQGPQLAAFTPEQQQAFATGREQFGAQGLAGTPLGQASTYYSPALAATALGTTEIGTEDIQRRMDPFLQNVVDIAKREARRDEDVARQSRAARAVGAGSFGGSRDAIIESEANRNLQRQLSDIQAAGLSTSFQNAQRAAEAQRAREMAGGRQFAGLGESAFQRARGDITGLAGVGEAQQARSQQALDIARRQFEEEKAFPQTALQRYASIIRGFPLTPSQQIVTAAPPLPTPSLAQTMLGAAGTGVGLYGAFGGFKKAGGLVGLLGGGTPTNPLRPPYNLFSGPSSRVGVPQYQSGGPLGVNLGASGGPSTAFNIPTTAPSPMDLNMIMEELRRRGSRRSAGGLAGLTVSSHKEGEQPSLGSRIMNWGPGSVPSLAEILEYYQTPTGESDITSLGDPRYPWNREVNPEMGTQDGKTFEERGGLEALVEKAGEIAEEDVFGPLGIYTPEYAAQQRDINLQKRLEEQAAGGSKGVEPLGDVSNAAAQAADVARAVDAARAADAVTEPELGTPTPDDPYAGLLAQLPDTSAGLDEARAAEEKYLAALQGIEHDPDLWAAFAKASAQFGTATPQEGESLGTLAMKQMPEFIEDVVEIKGSEKDIGIRLAEAEKDMAVRAAGLKSAAAQQSFNNMITLANAQTSSELARLKIFEGMDDISKQNVSETGAIVRDELSRISNSDNLQGILENLNIEGLTTDNFDEFSDLIGKKVSAGGTRADIESDSIKYIAVMAKQIFKTQKDPNWEDAIKDATMKYLTKNKAIRTPSFWARLKLGEQPSELQ